MAKTKIEIIEVGPRDGLQNENQILSYKIRNQLIKKLSQTGLKRIEVGAFVSPKWVPQMEDSLKVALASQRLNKNKDFIFSALVPNKRGLEEFLRSGLQEASFFTACTDSFTKKNINCTVKESLSRFKDLIQECKSKKIKVRAYLSTSFGCPFEGEVSPRKVAQLTEKLLKLGVNEISLGDTIGVATPKQIQDVFKALIDIKGISPKILAGHFHDTRGTALSNVLASLEFGITKFDSCVGGLGGCPYAPGAAGNLATEDLVYTLGRMGYETNLDLNALVKISRWLQTKIGHPVSSHLSTASVF